MNRGGRRGGGEQWAKNGVNIKIRKGIQNSRENVFEAVFPSPNIFTGMSPSSSHPKPEEPNPCLNALPYLFVSTKNSEVTFFRFSFPIFFLPFLGPFLGVLFILNFVGVEEGRPRVGRGRRGWSGITLSSPPPCSAFLSIISLTEKTKDREVGNVSGVA